MLISAVCRVTFLLLLGLAPLPAAALSMAFINPGKSDEPYWSLASAAMQQAADNLRAFHAAQQPQPVRV